jgi:peptidoglycan-associated lipoprotein
MKRSSAKTLLLVFAGLVLASCTSTAPNSPAVPPSSSSVSSSQKPAGSNTATSIGQASPGSSLDAHSQGSAARSGPLKDIYFDFDRFDLRDDARAILKANATWLKANPSARVEIEGHCDDRGTSEYNLALGAKRAQAAKQYLESLGIGPGRLSTISYGEELAACRQRTEDCYQQNRRDRFVVRSHAVDLS